MTPADYMEVKAGDRILDLCAAPGGKSTELGAKLRGTGALVSNDISASRAKALLKNIELQGIPNCYVTAETPEKLAHLYQEMFDRILIDAPCSGEGMFRKDPTLIKSWMEKGPDEYHKMQIQIVDSAVDMLRPGGTILYSTCTFSRTEDEETIGYLLEQHPEMELLELPKREGFQPGIKPYEGCVRLYPHHIEGEGHFIALLRKKGEQEPQTKSVGKEKPIPKEVLKLFKEFFEYVKPTKSNLIEQYSAFEEASLFYKDDSLYLLPKALKCQSSLRYLRTGLLLGTVVQGKKFEPSQALAMCLKKSDYPFCVSLKQYDINVIKYLKGETIALPDDFAMTTKAPVLVCVDDYPLGWGKVNGTMLKNKYAPGWRMQ